MSELTTKLKAEEVINGLETAERRIAILKLICRRRFETIANLAYEFDVSERTIRRDIEFLMRTEPIYTQPGRYGGGTVASRFSIPAIVAVMPSSILSVSLTYGCSIRFAE